MSAFLNFILSYFEMEIKCLLLSPAVLKTVESTRRTFFIEGQRFLWNCPKPLTIRSKMKGRNDGLHHIPGIVSCPQNARSPRSKHPFVGSRCKKVATGILHGYIFNTKSMDAIYTEIDPLIFGPVFIFIGDDIRHLAQG